MDTRTQTTEPSAVEAATPKWRRLPLLRFGILLLVVGAVGAAVWYGDLSMYASLDALREWVQQFGVWAPLVFTGVYALSTVLFLPGSVFTVAAGVLFGPWFGTLYSLAGASVGAVIAFGIVRVFGAPLAQRLLTTRLQGIAKYEERLAHRGFATVLFLRLVPLFPFNGLNFVLGLTRVSWRDYVLATVIGMVPGGFLYVLVGASLLTRDVANIGLAVIAASAFGFVTYRFRRTIARYVFRKSTPDV